MVNRSSFVRLIKGNVGKTTVYAIKILNSLFGQFHPDKIQIFPNAFFFFLNSCLLSFPAPPFQGPRLTHAPATTSCWGFCRAWEQAQDVPDALASALARSYRDDVS